MRGRPVGGRPVGDGGTALAEFVMISILLVMLLFGVLQLAVYFYVRSLVIAQVDASARAAAASGADVTQACPRVTALLRRNVSASVADNLICSASVVDGGAGLAVIKVQAHGTMRTTFLPLGALVHIDVTGQALQEPTP